MSIHQKYPSNKVKKFLKEKKLLIAAWSCKNAYYAAMNHWIPAFSLFFNNVQVFDPQEEILKEGFEAMNKKFIKIVRDYQPDFLFLYLINHSLSLESLFKIKEVSPKTRVINLFMDDDTQFEVFSRYYSLFCDYTLITQPNFLERYKKESKTKAIFVPGVYSGAYIKKGGTKKYEVSFIGGAKKIDNRYRFLKYLANNGVDINIFGSGWDKFNDLKNFYRGAIPFKEIIEVINKSKINLSFSKNKFGENNLKLRNFEIASSGSFLLAEYCPQLNEIFMEGRNISMFKDEEELLKKVNYYLKNEKERRKIEEKSYAMVRRKYDVVIQLNELFESEMYGEKNKSNRFLGSLKEKVCYLSKEDFSSEEKIKDKIKGYNYISFIKGKVKFSKYRAIFQAHSLKVTGKPISCCSYYAYSNRLGNYLFFSVYEAFRTAKRENFISSLNINQLIVEKKYFEKNIDLFRKAFFSCKIEFLDEKNTAFVSIPLLKILDFGIKKREVIRDAFEPEFLKNFKSVVYSKKIFANPFFYYLFIEGLTSKRYMLSYLIGSLTSSEKVKSLKRVISKRT